MHTPGRVDAILVAHLMRQPAVDVDEPMSIDSFRRTPVSSSASTTRCANAPAGAAPCKTRTTELECVSHLPQG